LAISLLFMTFAVFTVDAQQRGDDRGQRGQRGQPQPPPPQPPPPQPPPPQPPPPQPPPPQGAQYPTLLNGYKIRPAWKVVGVDYYVGVPVGIKLSDWQNLQGPGINVVATASPPYVVVYDTNNVTISGVDFSLHGGAFIRFANCSNPSVINSNFGGPNLSNIPAGVIIADSYSPNLTVMNTTIDGAQAGGTGPGGSSLISNQGGGITVIEYNWLKNAPQHVLEEAQQTSLSMSLVYSYNLVEQSGWQVGAHPNYLQFDYGDASSVLVEYNTFYNTPQTSSGESLQFYDNGSGYVSNVTWAYNVMIATGGPPGSARSSFIHGGGSQNNGMGYDNYVDTTGAWFLYYPGSMTGWQLNNNYNMVTGALAS
jgi:hypothetical protein